MITNDASYLFVSDNLDSTVPDHNFLFPEFEIVIETEDEIMPAVVERDDESEIIGTMGKETVSKLIRYVSEYLKERARHTEKRSTEQLTWEASTCAFQILPHLEISLLYFLRGIYNVYFDSCEVLQGVSRWSVGWVCTRC